MHKELDSLSKARRVGLGRSEYFPKDIPPDLPSLNIEKMSQKEQPASRKLTLVCEVPKHILSSLTMSKLENSAQYAPLLEEDNNSDYQEYISECFD
jgi:hypothetical protein